MSKDVFDVAIVGGGPAGLSAALVLGRSRRRVVVVDHGQPRNYAAKAVHCYLGLDGIKPDDLRRSGRDQSAAYGVDFINREVLSACRSETDHGTIFELQLDGEITVRARKILLATGIRDEIPDIANIDEFYGTSVHHCPYCDGWEHRDEHLVAFGQGDAAVELGLELLNWSATVTVCTNGKAISEKEMARLSKRRIAHRNEPVRQLLGTRKKLERIIFSSGDALSCDALFFAASKRQRSHLPSLLGCECDDVGLIVSKGKQDTEVPGLFIAGDADGDVQFAIVAAAEGAIAATAINRELQAEELARG
jgi:thioredoxin reductase